MNARSLLSASNLFRSSARSNITLCTKVPSRSTRHVPSSTTKTLSSLGRSDTFAGNDEPLTTFTREARSENMEIPRAEEHHLHILSSRHNCHLTLTGPTYFVPGNTRARRDILLTLSSGNVGFKKAARGSYDAVFQLGTQFIKRMKGDGHTRNINRLELVFRGFGNGREVMQKLLAGAEGMDVRNKIIRVVDSTRLKHGGNRASNPRRLG